MQFEKPYDLVASRKFLKNRINLSSAAAVALKQRSNDQEGTLDNMKRQDFTVGTAEAPLENLFYISTCRLLGSG